MGYRRSVRISGMNHAVLYVRDANRTATFYQEVLGFTPVSVDPGGRFAFLRANASDNHHDIAFFTVGPDAGPPTDGRFVGLYHVAWQVPTMEDLVDVRERLLAAGALVGQSDHGPSKSLYAKDPDGLEFEVMYLTPADSWGAEEHEAVVRPLDLEAERARWTAVES
jgi:catechol-2,3-dioxygenase